MKVKSIVLAALLILGVTACEKNPGPDLIGPIPIEPIYSEFPSLPNSPVLKSASSRQFELYMAEYYTIAESGEYGKIIYFFETGNKQMGAHFVPFDNATFDGTQDITYYIDNTRPSTDVPPGEDFAAIERAMSTWDNVTCSDFGLTQIPSDGHPTGVVAYMSGFADQAGLWADVTHCGWLPAGFFDVVVPPDGSTFVLGITFTYIWVDGSGPTDIDNNKKADVAFREIYYNDEFSWATDGGHIDIETVALHETGHGLSQAHFGKLFMTVKNGEYHFAPRALMNNGYTGIIREVRKTDLAGHCSIWGTWPNN